MTIELDPKALTAQQIWNSPQLAVIVPSYKERDNIAPLYDKVSAALGEIPFEFIVVDDNSPDGTAAVVKDMARRHANVRCIHRIGRRGLSSAVIEGISASAAPYFAVIDADHQHDERILPQMLDKALAGDDIVVGTRYSGAGQVGEGEAERTVLGRDGRVLLRSRGRLGEMAELVLPLALLREDEEEGEQQRSAEPARRGSSATGWG